MLIKIDKIVNGAIISINQLRVNFCKIKNYSKK